MSAAVGFFILAAAALVVFVARPLFSADAAERERQVSADSALAELQSRHQMALAALRDLEDDRSVGKLDDEDYARLRSSLTAQAVGLMKRLEAARRTTDLELESPPATFVAKETPPDAG